MLTTLHLQTQITLPFNNKYRSGKIDQTMSTMRLNIKKMESLECIPQTDATIHVDGQELNETTQFKYLLVPHHLRGQCPVRHSSSCQCSINKVLTGQWSPLQYENDNPPQKQGLQNCHLPWSCIEQNAG